MTRRAAAPKPFGAADPPAVVDHIRAGGLAIHPTETVYGVGGVLSEPALTLLRRIKRRPVGGFVILVPSRAWVDHLLSDAEAVLADAFWPGPLTLVLDDPSGQFPDGVRDSDGSIAVRVCGHPLTASLLEALDEPITSSSANAPGARPPRTFVEARKVEEGAGIGLSGLDAGPLPGSPPSTLADVRTGRIRVLRPGRVSTRELQKAMEGR